MKLLRYGPAGQEKPGLLDRDGKIRDLSGAVRDIDGETLAPASLDRLRRLDPASLPLVAGSPRLGPCVGECLEDRRDRPQLPPARGRRRARRSRSEPIFFMKATSSICGPERRRDHPKELAEDRLGGRARHRHRQPRPLRRRSRRAQACRRLLRRQRRFRARIPDRARRAMDQGQERRHLLSDRPVAGHRRRGRPIPASSRCGPRSTASGVQNSNTADLIFGVDDIVSYVSQFMTLVAGRRDPDRHALWGRHGHEAAANS